MPKPSAEEQRMPDHRLDGDVLVIGFGLYLLIFTLGFLAVIGVAYFIYRDASMRGVSEPSPLA